jgi:CBS domain-containing protein
VRFDNINGVRKMKVSEIMTANPVTVRPETTVAEIARLLTERKIGGIPVTDADGRVLGVVTENDLFLKQKGMPFSAVKMPKRFAEWVQPERLADIYAAARHHTAAGIMSRNPVTVGAADSIGHVAWEMARHDVGRVLVLRDGCLVGIITRADIIRLLARDE